MTLRTGLLLTLSFVVPPIRPAFHDNSLSFAATVAGTIIVSKVAYDAISLFDMYKLPELYNRFFVKQPLLTPDPSIKIGLLKICGDIFGVHPYIEKIEACAQDDSIKALIVYIDSNGGSPGNAELIFRELCHLKTKKPVIVVIDGVCYSGGYMIACAADHIIATSSAEVGNIGTRCTIKYFTESPEETIGGEKGKTKTEYLVAGKFKVTGCNLYEKPTEEERAYMQDLVDQHNEIFCEMVAQARGLSLDKKHEWADGKLFVAKRACELGLIDSCGSWTDAQQVALDLIKKRDPNANGPLKIVAF